MIERMDRVATRLLVASLSIAVTLGVLGIISGRAFTTLEIVGFVLASVMLVVLVFAPWD